MSFIFQEDTGEETQTQKVLSGTVSQNLGKDYGFVAVLSLCFTIVAQSVE